ncbi:general substrate transporter [Lophiostoma macrostomum CBS 122681]|uniref:General substrate transporter n=1 Tax=Lophiostoma macrostomum CBS 122681 TaxID=1314788 RepID=A0A6A6T4R3_9PLEO|nr:general substrate transporter [Lophiostoma macrostomum CBS 122681]
MTAAQVSGRQFRTYNVLVILAMSFGSIAMGYSGSIIGSTLAQDTFYVYFELTTRPNGTSLISAMNGLFQAGAFFGALCISWVGDKWGRKASITVPALLVVLSGALLAGSVHIGMFLTFRFFSGMGSFWLLGSIPVWMTEIVPPRNRGLLVDIHSAALLFGYALASWCGFGFFHMRGIDAWRGPLALQCLPALIVIGVMKWLPESPRWLIQKGRHDDARRVLSKLHQDTEASLEFAQIEAQLRLDNSLPNSWSSLITKPSYRKRALYAVGLACGIQFTGVLVINNYGAIIYGGLGYEEDVILLFHAGFNTLAWVCGMIAMFIIDLFPRNVLVALGTAMVTSCLAVEAALVANFPIGSNQNNDALRAAAAMTFCYIAFAQLFLDGTQYVYYAELFPNHLRAKGMTIGMAAISLMNVMWLQVAPTAFEKITWKFYLCFIIPAYLFSIVCFFYYPNTKGMALEEIAALFGDEVEQDVYHTAEPVGAVPKDSPVDGSVHEHHEKV